MVKTFDRRRPQQKRVEAVDAATTLDTGNELNSSPILPDNPATGKVKAIRSVFDLTKEQIEIRKRKLVVWKKVQKEQRQRKQRDRKMILQRIDKNRAI